MELSNIIPSTKDEIQRFVESEVNDVKEGNKNPLELTAKLKAFKKAIEQIEIAIKEETMNEAGKYGKSFEAFGYKIETRDNGTRYDYKACQDVVWEDLSKKLKDREAFLKALKQPLTEVDEITEEVFKIYPPIKTSSTGLTFTLK